MWFGRLGFSDILAREERCLMQVALFFIFDKLSLAIVAGLAALCVFFLPLPWIGGASSRYVSSVICSLVVGLFLVRGFVCFSSEVSYVPRMFARPPYIRLIRRHLATFMLVPSLPCYCEAHLRAGGWRPAIPLALGWPRR